jgi:hypothetical protein
LKPIRNTNYDQQIQKPSEQQIYNLQQNHQVRDYPLQTSNLHDSHIRQTQRNQAHTLINFEDSELQQQTDDLSQTNIHFGSQSYEKPRNNKFDATHQTRNNQEQNSFNHRYTTQQKVMDVTPEPSRVQPLTFEKYKPDQENVKPQLSETQKFILEENDYNNYQQHNEKPKVTEYQRPVQLTDKIEKLDLSQKSEDFTLGIQQTVNQSNLEQNHQTPQLNSQTVEFHYPRKHSTESNIDLLSQQHQSVQLIDLNQYNEQLRYINSERISSTTEVQELLSTKYPFIKPLIRPTSRYSKPWQVSQIHTTPQESQDNQKQSEIDNDDVQQSKQNPNRINIDTVSSPTRSNLPNNNHSFNSRPFEQKDFNQQTQVISFEGQSSQLELDQQQQKTKNNLEEGLISLNKKEPINVGSEIESSTTPQTFWKRVGHKISESIDKVKEKTKNIFG